MSTQLKEENVITSIDILSQPHEMHDPVLDHAQSETAKMAIHPALWFESESRADQIQGVLSETVGPSRSDYMPVIIRPSHIRQDKFVSLQKWECIVLSISTNGFVARLTDLAHKIADEEAEFLLDEVPPADLPLLNSGAVFYWSVGYIDALNGQRTRASVIRFRRLPVWTKEEIDRSRANAQRLKDSLGWK